MQKFTACNLPEAYETIKFDANGVCNICCQKSFKDEKIDWKLVKRLMLAPPVRKGDFCSHCHTDVFAYPMHVALKYQVPLVFWEELSSEYNASSDYQYKEIKYVDETRFNRFINLGITAEGMYGMIKDGYECETYQLTPYTPHALRDLKRLKYQLGSRNVQVEGMP